MSGRKNLLPSKLSPLHSVSDGRACQECMNPPFGWCHVAAGTQHKAYLRTKLASKLRSQASHYDSHAADTNAPYNMLTHSKSGYGFGSVYISDTCTFLIHIRFCSLCILLRRSAALFRTRVHANAFTKYSRKCWRAPRTCLQS